MIANEEGLRRLMRLSQGGDKQAYAILLEQCGAWLARYYRQKIAPDAIDDLVQETLMSLHRKRASYDPSRPFLPWLAAIAGLTGYGRDTEMKPIQSTTTIHPRIAMKKWLQPRSVSTVCST